MLSGVALPASEAGKCAAHLSGGTRRKLSLGIALVGTVDALLLDEPFSGMVRCQHLFEGQEHLPSCVRWDVAVCSAPAPS